MSGARSSFGEGASTSLLSYDFAPYSPRSRHWIDFAEAEQQHLLAQELERTGAAFTAAAEAKVSKGGMTPDEAKQGRLLWFSIGIDLGYLIAADRQAAAGIVPEPIAAALARNARDTGFTWADKVRAMRDELEHRRSTYPADVDKGRLAPEHARQQLERLEAVHYLYWHLGFAFDGDRDAVRAHANALADAIERAMVANNRERETA